ncbi:hypothetical protein AGOR_G00237440 [Albula goreensis]|uniref:SH3 domain-containing GRB2-like protein B1 n=1 Tax=Albula goreensis TaxID=1534307 RepID=A0A8T3CJ04_9TELE|nr:hypothetical protein AGOR_G00237440 [Albula goreensis]
MDFTVKRLAADAGTFLSRAVQFTEEKLGQAEKTDLDTHLENLLTRAECTKHWTEKIMKQTEVLLQPNPNVRIEEFLYDKLEMKGPTRPSNHEQLGGCMIDSGHELGPGTAYGSALIKCGETERQIGGAEREFIQRSTNSLLVPFRNFIEGDFKTILREQRTLQNKRLDLDIAKSRLKKARLAEAKSAELSSTPPLAEEYGAHFSYMLSFLHVKWLKMWTEEEAQAERELRMTQSEFDRQAEITRLLLEGLSSTNAYHLRCLNDFVEAQTTYYAQCQQYMLDLQKQLGSFASMLSSNNHHQTSLPSTSVPTATSSVMPIPPSSRQGGGGSGGRQARVISDYSAADSDELTVTADEVVMVSSVPGMDSDWLMAERGSEKGKVPIRHLEMLD